MNPAPTRERAIIVLADVVNSRALSAETRRALQVWLRALGGERLGFRFTGGDEFEWRLPEAPDTLDRLLITRATLASGAWGGPPILLRCALGIGIITVSAPESPYAEDGPAYHRAREAMAALKAWQERKHRSATHPFQPGGGIVARTAAVLETPDPVLDALLLQMDGHQLRWTAAQYGAIALLLEGHTQATIAERLGVSQPAVASRLRAADLDRYLVAHQAVRCRLARHTLDTDPP